ncbi:hypothetical protein StoSoilB13_10100 [Arthrobacter sp. StoSoilB13]|nr:hypothetical protein StoSoilB13_10100 [Arthrobacter sp. StoSoilB13]
MSSRGMSAVGSGDRIVARSEVVHGMRIDWDVPVPMADGTVLRADVFRPDDEGVYPVLMTLGPYGKGLAFQEGFTVMWQRLASAYPDAVAGSTNAYQVWETVDPEKWVPDGYICIRVDSRGTGRSAGRLDMLSEQEARDYYQAIEWGRRPGLVERQGGPARDLLLRRQPVAGRGVAAAAPHGNLSMGGVHRLLPGLQPARRYSVAVRAGVAGPADLHGPIWGGRAWPAQPE